MALSPTVILKTLRLRAFRSFVQEQTLDLPQSGMVLLDGPSGAGKSSLVEALALALGYSDFSATDLQSWEWLTKESLRVVVEMDTPEGEVVLTKGKPSHIVVAGTRHTSAKAVVEHLQASVGLDPQYLKALTYRAQQTRGLFLSMTDSEKKSFLTTLLGLGEVEKTLDESSSAISRLEHEHETASYLLQAAKKEVGDEPPAPSLIDTEPLQRAHDAMKADVNKAQKTYKDLDGADYEMHLATERNLQQVRNKWTPILLNLETTWRNLRTSPASLPNEAGPRLTTLNQQVADLQAKTLKARLLKRKEADTLAGIIHGLQAVADKKPKAMARLTQAEADRDQLLAERCYVCKRPWQSDDGLTEALKAADLDISALNKTIADAGLAAGELPGLQTGLEQLNAEVAALEATDGVPDDVRQQLQEAQVAWATHLAQERARQAEHGAAYSAAAAELEKAKREATQEEAAAQLLSAEHMELRERLAKAKDNIHCWQQAANVSAHQVALANQQNKAAADAFQVAHDDWAKRAAKAERLAADLETKADVLRRERDFSALLRGFLALIFDETLARIATLTNERLARIPNVETLTLEFTSEHETKTTKTIRQEIRAVVRKQGHAIPLRAGTSGGMYSAIELATDLSMADVIAERTGVYPGWLVLDEAFDGLDAPIKRACFEMLRDAAGQRLVIVVDHSQDFKELFDRVIEIRSEDGQSVL